MTIAIEVERGTTERMVFGAIFGQSIVALIANSK